MTRGTTGDPHKLSCSRFAWLSLLALFLLACRAASLEPAEGVDHPPAATLLPGAPLSPVPTPRLSQGTATPQAVAITSSSGAERALAPRWTQYDSLNEIRDLAFGPDGGLWALTAGGLVRRNLDAGTLTRYQLEASQIAVDLDGTVWLAEERGVCHFDGVTCKRYSEAQGLVPGTVRALAIAPDGSVWVGGEGGASRFAEGVWTPHSSPAAIHDLAVAPDGSVWAATAGGVARYQPAQAAWTTYAQAQGLPATHSTRVAAGPGGRCGPPYRMRAFSASMEPFGDRWAIQVATWCPIWPLAPMVPHGWA